MRRRRLSRQPRQQERKVPDGIVTALQACGPSGGPVAKAMKKINYSGYRFPPERQIQCAQGRGANARRAPTQSADGQ